MKLYCKAIIILYYIIPLILIQLNMCLVFSLDCFKRKGLTTITPNDALYNENTRPYYTSGTIYKPKGIIKVKSVSEIKRAIWCASNTGTHLTIKSGGHSYEGYSYGSNNSWIIDLSNMNNIVMNDNKTITVESGVKLKYLTKYLYERGYVIPAGICNDVGISGLALGGGIGLLSRKYGTATDQIESLEIVTADRHVKYVSRKQYPDLFWALHGGGGSFGVVTKLTMKIHPAPTCNIAIHKTYNRSFASELFYKWQNYIISMKHPDSLSSTMIFNGVNGDANVDFEILGELQSQCDSTVKEIIQIFPGIEDNNIIKLNNYFEAQQRVGKAYIVPTSDLPKCYITMNFLVKRRLSMTETRKAIDLLYNSDNIFSMFVGTHGGKINGVRRKDAAFVHRDAEYIFELFSDSDCSNEAKVKLKQLFKKYSFMDNGESYQNLISRLHDDYLHRYYGENLGRLMHIKSKYDPENFFCFPQSIPPSLRSFNRKCPFTR